MSPNTDPAAKPRRWIPTPKTLITIFITLIVFGGEAYYGAMGGFHKLIVTLGTCVVTEAVLSLFVLRRMPSVQSAYISGMSLSLLLRPMEGFDWPLVAAAVLSIASKYVLRYRGKHLWNPSNFGLAIMVLLAPAKVALLSHELGNDIWGNVAIWVVGLMVASRARVLHITATYAVSFALLAVLRAFIVGTPIGAEIAPLTGPMYQLLCFFMLTDPPTTVDTVKGRVFVTVLIALLECGFRLANDFHLPYAEIVAPAPPIIALFVIGPIAFALNLKQRSASAPRAVVQPAA